jgi:hypothetical protein
MMHNILLVLGTLAIVVVVVAFTILCLNLK